MIKYFDKGAKLPLWNNSHVKKEVLLNGNTGDTGFIDDNGNFKKANIELRGNTTYGKRNTKVLQDVGNYKYYATPDGYFVEDKTTGEQFPDRLANLHHNDKPLNIVSPEFDIITLAPVANSYLSKTVLPKVTNFLNRQALYANSKLYSDNPISNYWATMARKYNLPDKARLPPLIRTIRDETKPPIENGNMLLHSNKDRNHTNFTWDRRVVAHPQGGWDQQAVTVVVPGRDHAKKLVNIDPSDSFTDNDPANGFWVNNKRVIAITGNKDSQKYFSKHGVKNISSPELDAQEIKVLKQDHRKVYDPDYWKAVQDNISKFGHPKMKDVKLLEKTTGLNAHVLPISEKIKYDNYLQEFNEAFKKGDAETVGNMFDNPKLYPDGYPVKLMKGTYSYTDYPYFNLFYNPATEADLNYFSK